MKLCKLFFLTLIFLFSFICNVWADITGSVFNDFNGDGSFSVGNLETGLPDILVSAFDSSGALVAQATTFQFNCSSAGVPDSSCLAAGAPSRGSYVLPTAVPGPFRIEFTVPAAGLNFLSAAPGSGTSVQFASDGDIVNLGLFSKGEYCQSNPDVLFSCFSRGDSAGNLTSIAASAPYTASGRDPSLETELALADEGTYVPGSVWGNAYDARTGKFYVSAARRAYSGVGSEGLGAIHEIDLNAPLPNITLWNTIPNPGTSTQTFSPEFRDTDGFINAGKVGIGDIDISDDYTKLYVMGLTNNGVLHEYDIATNTLLNSYPVGDPGCSDPSDVRPWATTFHQGEVYVGLVCSEEAAGGLDSNLQAFVLKLDPASGLFSTVANMPLDYVKDSSSANCNPQITGWFRWDSNPSSFSDSSRFCNPQPPIEIQDHPTPILGDIEFDTDGSMILGFIDRFSMQSPHFQVSPDPADGGMLFSNNAAGDIKRLCFSGAGFLQEGSPGCPFNPGATVNEFYPGDDFLFGAFPGHAEVFSGGLALLRGSGQVVGTAYDALNDPGLTGSSFGTSGLRYLNNSTGALDNAYETVPQSNNIFSKALTLGDVELRCLIPPIEVGNFVWEDLNNNGIQDPNETPLAGVTVELLSDTTGDGVLDTVIATAVTDANGNYLFSSDEARTASTTANFIYGLAGNGPDELPNTADDVPGLKPSFDSNGDGIFTDPGDILNNYGVRIASVSTQLPGLTVTTSNADGQLLNAPLVDIRDSDATSDGTDAFILFSTSLAGDNNQTLDFGFTTSPPPTASLGQTVWLDTNGDGIRDPDELGVVGVTVTATFFGADGVPGGGDDEVFTTTTDSNGNYIFADLVPGEYKVTFTPPTGFDFTLNDTGGNDALDSDADPITGMTGVFTLNPGEFNNTVDAGLVEEVIAPGLASVLWNGFCDQQNFVSLTNTCSDPVTVTVALFGSVGDLLSTVVLELAGGEQLDYSINDMEGFSMFDNGRADLLSMPGGCISGEMGLFTPLGNGQFFSSPILNESLGASNFLFAQSDGTVSNSCFAAFNTFQPSVNPEDIGIATIHFLQLVNLDRESRQDFTVRRFDILGTEISNEQVSLEPGGRQDLSSGHEDEILNRYGMIEVSPVNIGADYTAQLFRYGMDSTTIAGERVSSFSLADNCSVGLSGVQYLSVSKGAGAENWMELYNLSDSPQTINVDIYSNSRGAVDSFQFLLNARQSLHFNASEELLDGESGVAEINSEQPLLTKSTSYLYRADGRILASESTEGRLPLGLEGQSSYNSFRNQLNWLRLYNIANSALTVTVRGFGQFGDVELGERTIELLPVSGMDINLNEILSLGPDSVGRVEITVSQAGALVAEIVRVEHESGFTQVRDIEILTIK